MTQTLVAVRDVHKVYTRGSERIDVLQGLNLEVPKGEFLALMGPSGSGKTTLLNLIGGLDKPTSGQVVVGGQDLTRASGRALARWRASQVGFVFQFYNLLPVLTAARNIELPLLLTKLSRAERRKLEGGERTAPTVARLVDAGVPVMGHLGLTPQSIYRFGTYKVRAQEEEEAEQLIKDALLLEKAGCFAIVLEKIPAVLAAEVAARCRIPVIGIGAGPGCDGQVLVTHDLLGLTTDFSPRFVRRYAHLADLIHLQHLYRHQTVEFAFNCLYITSSIASKIFGGILGVRVIVKEAHQIPFDK